MITSKEAEVIANQYLMDLQGEIGDPLQLTKIQEEPFGWIFFYQTKDYMETGNLSSMLAGNAPFIVDRKAGTVHVLGTVHPVDVYIKEYKKIHG
ncbi:MAG: YrhB domain-containing protein [Azovibrio sp.]